MRNCFLQFVFCLFQNSISACTILSGVDAKGHTWACNNEDWWGFSFYNYINVHPRDRSTKYGYITLTYGEPGAYIQGGVNEAGLFFDFNALPPVQTDKNALKAKRTLYPGGREAMLTYILKNCMTVREVLEIWNTYYMELHSQIHLTDASGNMAIITPDSIIRQERSFNVSTNFNLCDPDPVKYKCWRYPIAERILKEEGISRETMLKAAKATFRRSLQARTLYTNLHNLNTGDMWVYFGEDSSHVWHTNIHSLLKKGKQSYQLKELFPEHNAVKLDDLIKKGASQNQLVNFLNKGAFSNEEKESMLGMCYMAYLTMENNMAKADLVFPIWKKIC